MSSPLTTGPAGHAERVARYVLHRVRARSPHKWRQAPRTPAGTGLPANAETSAELAAPSWATFRSFRIAGVSELAYTGLGLLANGFPVLVTDTPLRPEELLELQSQGARCITLLPDGAEAPPPHTDALDFVLHDLCHLAKFADPEHHAAQVGLFATLARAFAQPSWQRIEAALDDTWRADRAAVSADMNGSCVFLFAVLKMRLRMAARRSLARKLGVVPPSSGAATREEDREFSEIFAVLLDAMALPPDVRSAALTTNARRDDPLRAELLRAYFDAFGRAGAAASPAASAGLSSHEANCYVR